MSGRSYNHNYSTVEYEYVDKMYDNELNRMMKDLVKVLHDLEWWQSDDICEETYRKTVDDFKKKWFHRTKEDYRQIVIEEFEKKRDELLKEIEL